MKLVLFDSGTWVNPEDVVAVTSSRNGYDSTIELRSGTRFVVDGSPKKTAEKLMSSSA